MPDAIDGFGNPSTLVCREANGPSTLKVHAKNVAVDANPAAFENYATSWLQFLAWVNESAPHFGFMGFMRFAGFTVQQQALDEAAGWNAMPEQPSRKHARIVENEKVARLEITLEMGKRHMLEAPVAMDDEQP